MSRNSKSATRHAQAKVASERRKNGGSGPALTTPKHEKKKAWWQVHPYTYSAWIKGAAKRQQQD